MRRLLSAARVSCSRIYCEAGVAHSIQEGRESVSARMALSSRAENSSPVWS